MFNTGQNATTNKYMITDFSTTVPNHSTTETNFFMILRFYINSTAARRTLSFTVFVN